LERIEGSPKLPTLPDGWELWYDGGHNDSAGAALAEQIRRWNAISPMPTHMILGMKSDKDPKAYLEHIMPQITSLCITRVNDIGACLNAVQIEPILQTQMLDFVGESENPSGALEKIINRYKEPKARIIICGSLYLAERL
jgi:dihydrofolate synthase/folylpolyglutamate synthase